MKLRMFEFKADKVRVHGRIRGTVRMPHGARIIHIGANPPKGELCVWAECTSLVIGDGDHIDVTLLILRHDDEVPPGHVYRGYILANPMLFVYQFTGTTAANDVPS